MSVLSFDEYLLAVSCELGKVEQANIASDIAKGNLLAQVREYHSENSGERWVKAFKAFLKTQDITATKAYRLIEIADNATKVFAGDAEKVAAKMTRQAFYLALETPQEIWELIKDEVLTSLVTFRKSDVARLINEWSATTTDVLPASVKRKVENGSIPLKEVAPLVKELEELPEEIAARFTSELERTEQPAEEIKVMTKEAKQASKFLDKARQLSIFDDTDIEATLHEALDSEECLSLVAEVAGEAEKVQRYASRLFQSHKRLGQKLDRLYCETGANNPKIRSMITGLNDLSGQTVRHRSDKLNYDFIVRYEGLSEAGGSIIANLEQENVELRQRVKELQSKLLDVLAGGGPVDQEQAGGISEKEFIRLSKESAKLGEKLSQENSIAFKELEKLGFSVSVYPAEEERKFNEFVQSYKGWDIFLSIPNGGICACLLIKDADCFDFPVGDSDDDWEFHFDYLDDKGVLGHAKRAIDAVIFAENADGGPLELAFNDAQETMINSIEQSVEQIYYQDEFLVDDEDLSESEPDTMFQFTDFTGRVIEVDLSNVSIDPALLAEAKAKLMAVTSTDGIWAVDEYYWNELNGSYAGLKYLIYQDTEIVDHLFIVRLAKDLTRVADDFAEEKLLEEEPGISWAEKGLARLRQENGEAFGRAAKFLQQHNPQSVALLAELKQVSEKRQKAKAESAANTQ